ncbi:MAG TPA: hypothetical protein VK427_26400, partial [Kofleriaceae bacterium]|nr:hypothetical protein [Kofleriaceae bacterium]
ISNVKATCTQGCAVDTSLREFAPTSNQGALRSSIPKFLFAPRVLCAETPQAAVGDSCKLNGTMPCLPTRAQLAADGTVTGQTYLVCGADEKCAAAPAPVIPQYLEPCAPSYITQYGHPGVNAFATTGSGACLLAWNTATQAVATGRTTKCVGDWDCPAGSLCDDQVVSVHFNDFSAVCKPGPRGVLTPAMLAP